MTYTWLVLAVIVAAGYCAYSVWCSGNSKPRAVPKTTTRKAKTLAFAFPHSVTFTLPQLVTSRDDCCDNCAENNKVYYLQAASKDVVDEFQGTANLEYPKGVLKRHVPDASVLGKIKGGCGKHDTIQVPCAELNKIVDGPALNFNNVTCTPWV